MCSDLCTLFYEKPYFKMGSDGDFKGLRTSKETSDFEPNTTTSTCIDGLLALYTAYRVKALAHRSQAHEHLPSLNPVA